MADAIWEDVQLELADQSDSSHRDLGEALNGVSDALQRDGHDFTRSYVTDLVGVPAPSSGGSRALKLRIEERELEAGGLN